jgi:hypothetical protein
MKWKKWNDQLSLLGVLLIPCMWVSAPWTHLSEQIIGATIVVWTLMFQYYFRKAPEKDGQA